jgi:predicted nucleic acid-binding protein
MKVLLDTNIIIHRETNRIINKDIGKLFNWLDKIKADKYIHPVTEREINKLEIDRERYHRLVYRLYDLTKEEIEILEGGK